MKWVQTAWPLVRDILLTGTGLFLIIYQGFERNPSSAVLVVGLALTVPAAATHAASVLSGPSATTQHDPPSSSPPSPPPSSSPSSSAAGASGEGPKTGGGPG